MYYAIIYQAGSHPRITRPFTSQEERDSFITTQGKVNQVILLETSKTKMIINKQNKKSVKIT